MSVDRSLDLEVDLDENRVDATIVERRELTVDGLFRDGELRLWEDERGADHRRDRGAHLGPGCREPRQLRTEVLSAVSSAFPEQFDYGEDVRAMLKLFSVREGIIDPEEGIAYLSEQVEPVEPEDLDDWESILFFLLYLVEDTEFADVLEDIADSISEPTDSDTQND
jgi:hypothetical protein